MVTVETEYIATGGNRHPAAADWDVQTGLLAFGADRNIALWNPLGSSHRGIESLLSGHTDKVNAVKFLPKTLAHNQILLSGSVDRTIRLWRSDKSSPVGFVSAITLREHKGSINTLAVVQGSTTFASGSADRTVRIWKLDVSVVEEINATLLQTIELKPSFFPLAITASSLNTPGSLVLAVAGTKNVVQVYTADDDQRILFKLEATLTGHEGWIRSLAFTRENDDPASDLLLASACQDKYIRLWRVHKGKELPEANAAAKDSALGAFGKSLSNKAHRFEIGGDKYSVTFEALLLGHEDWIYTVSWRSSGTTLQLLSASADSSLSIWGPDANSGVWVCVARLGEISVQKGATTATGSPGGFWIGLWSPNGDSVVSLGRTGGWRLWNYDGDQDRWLQGIAITGHIKDVTGLTWAEGGSYLLSTSSDQTTRLHAEWRRGEMRSWHEFARPQIHGYDLNCIESIGGSQFISGADEKLLRVFDEPRATATMLERLCSIIEPRLQEMSDSANIPVLGLSNKAIQAVEDKETILNGTEDGRAAIDPSSVNDKSTFDLDHPPLEDHLARYTLWPESEKLYGHGYEISAVAASHDSSLVATACRASSINHAVIRIYNTREWREMKPPLTAHSLTVTCLSFSKDDHYLLSVGRDRQWTVFERSETQTGGFELKAFNPKGHSRMILDASWAPIEAGRVFATAGRDKLVKVWSAANASFESLTSITAASSVTSVEFLLYNLGNILHIAHGNEDGGICISSINVHDAAVVASISIDQRMTPSKSITQLSWRPGLHQQMSNGFGDSEEHHWGAPGVYQIAVASEDSLLRIYSISDLDS
ncbi:MAG: hypothetical protein M1827_005705 [Pycnora praestabilis]|nr:MAG: hypothetical protein M1827_005705 [Pycnora praestabilis]